MKQTISQSLIEGLLALGFKEVHPPRQSRRYRIFANSQYQHWPDKSYVFVGQNGALRIGRSGTTSSALQRCIPS